MEGRRRVKASTSLIFQSLKLLCKTFRTNLVFLSSAAPERLFALTFQLLPKLLHLLVHVIKWLLPRPNNVALFLGDGTFLFEDPNHEYVLQKRGATFEGLDSQKTFPPPVRLFGVHTRASYLFVNKSVVGLCSGMSQGCCWVSWRCLRTFQEAHEGW